MRKTQTIQRQVNLKNEAGFVVCPYAKIVAQRPLFSCHVNCDRYMGIDGGFVLCGAAGSNEVLKTTSQRKQPALWKVFGEGERDWMIGAYGKPKG